MATTRSLPMLNIAPLLVFGQNLVVDDCVSWGLQSFDSALVASRDSYNLLMTIATKPKTG